MKTENILFKNFLKRKGLTLTKQRDLVLTQVFKNHTHFEADEIVDTLRKNNSRVSRATVYRTLAHLNECGLIRKIDLGHGHSHFEHILGHQHHEHLYCEKCENIIEFSDPTLEERINEISRDHNFTITNHAVMLFGKCNKCNKKK